MCNFYLHFLSIFFIFFSFSRAFIILLTQAVKMMPLYTRTHSIDNVLFARDFQPYSTSYSLSYNRIFILGSFLLFRLFFFLDTKWRRINYAFMYYCKRLSCFYLRFTQWYCVRIILLSFFFCVSLISFPLGFGINFNPWNTYTMNINLVPIWIFLLHFFPSFFNSSAFRFVALLFWHLHILTSFVAFARYINPIFIMEFSSFVFTFFPSCSASKNKNE